MLLRNSAGIRNFTIESRGDVETALIVLMEALGITHILPEEGRVYVARGCEINENEVTMGLGPGAVLIGFGDPSDIRQADKDWMLHQFRELQNAVLG